MKRVNKTFCVALALVTASALAVPLVFTHGEHGANNDVLQLDVGNHATSAGGAGGAGASHVGSDGAPVIGTSFPEIEHFSFRPVLGDIDDLHAAADGAVLNVGSEPFPVASSNGGSATSFASGNPGVFGNPGAPAGFGGGMAFNLPSGYAPLHPGAPSSSAEGGIFLPLAAIASDAGNTDSSSDTSDSPAGSGGSGGTPGNTEGVFNPPFNASPNIGLSQGVPADGGNVVDVPEPATVALLGLGMLGFAVSRREAKRHTSRR
jgi:hypothetical protein